MMSAKRTPFGALVPAAFLSASLLLPISCASAPPPDSVETGVEYTVSRIRSNLSRKACAEALSDILRVRTDPAYSSEPIDSLYREAVELAVAELEAAAKAKNYAGALTHYRTLRVLDRTEDAHEWSEGLLLLSSAEELLDDSREEASFLVFQKALTSIGPDRTFPVEILMKFGEAARRHGNRSVLSAVAKALSHSGSPVPETWKASDETPKSPGELLRGTATVLVNRGMKIESGVGLPDRALGSAFFVDRDGYLLTNYHVISSEVDPTYEGFSRLFVIPSGSKDRIPAKVVGYDRIFDIALLKVKMEAPYTFFFDPDLTLKPGDPIYAIGSPVGLENTVTSGIISAVERRLLQSGDVLQIDVPVNPGNSGGPLLDRNGNLLGVVFAGISGYESLNFALPASMISEVFPALTAGGEVVRAWIGIALAEGITGLEVTYTLPGTFAERWGIASGDTIVSLNGVPCGTLKDTQKLLLPLSPGSLLKLTYRQGGIEKTAFLPLSSRPYNPIETALDKDLPEHVFAPLFGMSVDQTGSFAWNREFTIRKVYGGTVADESGLMPGDPFSLQSWYVDRKNQFAALGIYIKKRKAGFLETALQLTAYLQVDSFI